MATKQKVKNKQGVDYYFNFNDGEIRSWEDAQKYGFVSAGGMSDGGVSIVSYLKNIGVGSRVWLYVPSKGYVAVGFVTEVAVLAASCSLLVDGSQMPFFKLPRSGTYHEGEDEEYGEWVIAVKWSKSVPITESIWEKGLFSNPNVACQPKCAKWSSTIKRLEEKWEIA